MTPWSHGSYNGGMPLLELSALSALWLAAVEAPITSVTVYGDQARVVRTVRLNLSGPQRVELPALEGPVDPTSLRVEVQGAELVRVDLHPESTEGPAAPETRRLVTTLEQLGDQLRQVRAERDVYSAQLAALDKLRPGSAEEPGAHPTSSRQEPPPRLDASGWRAAVDFVGELTARLQAKRRELSQREETLSRELSRREQEARHLGLARGPQGLSVVPWVSGHGAATLSLSYLTAGASWVPAYEVRLDPDSHQVQVAFSGRVRQTTGEDWEDVALTLSTALPLGFAPAPELATWKIGQHERFIPTPSPLLDSWKTAPPAPPPPPQPPDEDARLRERLVALVAPTPEKTLAPDSKPAVDSRNPMPPAPRPEVAQKPPVEAPVRLTGQEGLILGVVRDGETRKTLLDVVVTATSPALEGERVVVTDAQGQYQLAALPAGLYTLRFDKEGFRPYSRSEIQLAPSRNLRVTVDLLPEANVSEEIVVTAQPPTIDVSSSSTGINASDFGRFSGLSSGTPPSGYAGGAERRATEVEVGLAPPAGWKSTALEPKQPAALAGGQVLSFLAQRRGTVRSGESERRVPLFTETWPVQLERELYPALTPNAFLVAQLRSPSARVLPGGEAQLFSGPDPVGQARLGLVSPGEPFTLPLGIDPAVRPVRNVQLVTSERGFIGKDELTEYQVTLELANPYPVPLGVRVHDQWPLSRDGHVEVKLLSTEPYAEQDADKGTLLWRLSLAPAQKQTLIFRYSVRHPKGWRLQQSQ